MSSNPPPLTGMISHQSGINPGSNYWCRDCAGGGGDIGKFSTVIAQDVLADNVATDFLFAVSTIFEASFSFSTIFDVAYGNYISTGNAYIDKYNGEELTVSSISTNVIDLDGNFLNTAGGDELLLNGKPLATTDQLSSIMDWATFPAVSSIVPTFDRALDVGQSTTRFRVGYFSSLVADQVIVLSTTLTLIEVVSSLFVDYQFASTIDADLARFSVMTTLDGSFSNLNASTAQISTLTNNYLNNINANISSLTVSSIKGNTGTFSTLNAGVGNFSTLIAPTGAVSSFVVNNGNFSSLTALDASISTLNGEIILASTVRARVCEASTLRGQQTFVSSIVGSNASFTNMTGTNITTTNGTFNQMRSAGVWGNNARFSTITVNPLVGGTITTSNITTSNITASNSLVALNGNITGTLTAPNITNTNRINGNIANFTTLNSRTGGFSSITVSSITVSTLNARTANISTLVASNALIARSFVAQENVLGNLYSPQANITRGIFSSITTSTINITNPSDNTSNWANFPALSNVNMNGSNLSNANTITGATGNFTTLNGTTTNATTLNASNINASNGYFSNILSNGGGILANGGMTVGPAGVLASINSLGDGYMRNLDVGDPFTSLGDLNVYGATNPPFDNALYVEGGVQFDGGFIHGFNAGCGPVGVAPFAVNTTRIDMTIAGIGLTAGQGFITQQALGAVAIQAGGAGSFSAGGAVSIASGDYIEMNAQNIKLNNQGCQIRFNANTGAGNPGGLPLGANGSNDLTLNALPFGTYSNYGAGTQTYSVNNTTTKQLLTTYSLPSLGQWKIKQTAYVSTVSGNPKITDLAIYYAPNSNAQSDPTSWNQSFFPPLVYDIANQAITFEGTLQLSTFTGSTIQYGSTIFDNVSSFVSTFVSTIDNPSPPPPYIDVSTFSTIFYTSSFTSTIFSTFLLSGGIGLFADGTRAQNSFTGEIVMGDFLASYLGRSLV